MFNVYMDDVRSGQFNGDCTCDWDEWVICRSTEQVKELLQAGLVNDLDLDHDMGRGDERDGTALMRWMCENDVMPKGKIYFHTANPEGLKNMLSILDSWKRSKE